MKVCSNCGEQNEDWMDICQRCGYSIMNANQDNTMTPHNSYENYGYNEGYTDNYNYGDNNYQDYNNYNYGYNESNNTPKKKAENLDLKIILVILLIVLLGLIIYTLSVVA